MLAESKTTYITKFISEKQIYKCAQYYIKLLGLQDWLITFKLVDQMSQEGRAGENECVFILKQAVIKLLKTFDPNKYAFKQPQELVLIHELLHCMFFPDIGNTYTDACYHMSQHQLLESMARAIFKARYNLTNDDFKIEVSD